MKPPKKKDAVRRCSSDGFECDQMTKEKIKHFVSKEAFNIDGFGKKIVENFWELKLIKFPQDIFKLDYKKIKSMDGWGNLSTSNLKYAIDSKKKIPLDRFIYSLGIRHIGQENAKLLARHLKTANNFFKLSLNKKVDELKNIDGIGDTQITAINSFFLNKTNQGFLFELKEILDIEDIAQLNQSGLLKNKTFMFTGKLEGISRAEAKSIIEENSGKIISNVNKKLDYLIIGLKPTPRKINLAKELDIKIINQKDWLKMLE